MQWRCHLSESSSILAQYTSPGLHVKKIREYLESVFSLEAFSLWKHFAVIKKVDIQGHVNMADWVEQTNWVPNLYSVSALYSQEWEQHLCYWHGQAAFRRTFWGHITAAGRKCDFSFILHFKKSKGIIYLWSDYADNVNLLGAVQHLESVVEIYHS